MNKIKISLLAIALVLTVIACKKKVENVSEVVTATYPTITLTGQSFYSIPVGGSVPNIAATAYDSLLKESNPVSLDASSLDATTPGLYTVRINAKNSLGYIGSKNVYVAVTDISPLWELSGQYMRTSNSAIVNVAKVANGLYQVDNVGGAPSLPVVGYFIQLNDSTIDFPLQPTSNVGDIDCEFETLINNGVDTGYSWKVVNPNFGTSIRTFLKQ